MATTYRNTIEVTELNFNTLATDNFFVEELQINIAVNANSKIYWGPSPPTPGGGEGTVTYRTVQSETSIYLHNIIGTDISGYTGGIFSDSSRNNNIGGTFTPVVTTNIGRRRYTGFEYTIWNDLSQNITSSSTTELVFFPDDDAGGPQTIVTDPGFIPIGVPISIKSTLTPTNAGNARVRYVGNDSESDPTSVDQNTITTIAGRTPQLFYPDEGGLWVGIDAEPTSLNEDYLYTFFASSTCYHSDTFLETSIGLTKIKDIKREMKVKTMNGFKKVVKLLSNGCKKREFVVFEKDSLGPNIPNQKLMITKGHPVYYRGKYLNCLEFVKNNFFDKIYLKQMETEGLYHIQFETHECISTHNMWTTSLPHNMGNKIPEELYFDKTLFNPDDKGKHYPPYCLHLDPPRDILDDDDLEHIGEFN